MNGRIYDPKLGRFLQADPFIQEPTNTQSLNRYSYVLNNPLNATDPSGYFSLSKTLKQFAGLIAGIIGSFICGPQCGYLGYALIGAASGAINAIVNGGDIFKSALSGAVSGAAFYAVGLHFGYELGDGIGQLATNALANGVVGGITNILAGGKFGHGFLSAGLSAFAKPGIRRTFGTEASGLPARVLARAVIGGTISEITGGKFANGATTAAFSQLFNEEPTLARERNAQRAGETLYEYTERTLGDPEFNKWYAEDYPMEHEIWKLYSEQISTNDWTENDKRFDLAVGDFDGFAREVAGRLMLTTGNELAKSTYLGYGAGVMGAGVTAFRASAGMVVELLLGGNSTYSNLSSIQKLSESAQIVSEGPRVMCVPGESIITPCD